MSDVVQCPLCQKYIDVTFKPEICPKCGENISAYDLKGQVYSSLYGVGGWLMLFCIGLIVIRPLLNLVTIVANFNAIKQVQSLLPSAVPVIYGEIALLVMMTAFSCFAGYMLWTIKPNAVMIAKIYLVAAVIFAVLDLLLVMQIDVSGAAKSAALQAGFKGIAQTLVYSVVWLAYLVKSERVRVTYLER